MTYDELLAVLGSFLFLLVAESKGGAIESGVSVLRKAAAGSSSRQPSGRCWRVRAVRCVWIAAWRGGAARLWPQEGTLAGQHLHFYRANVLYLHNE